jgi:hypothetical protein
MVYRFYSTAVMLSVYSTELEELHTGHKLLRLSSLNVGFSSIVQLGFGLLIIRIPTSAVGFDNYIPN